MLYKKFSLFGKLKFPVLLHNNSRTKEEHIGIIAQELQKAQQEAELKKKNFAEEVLAARKRSQDEIAKTHQEQAEMVQEAKAKANTEIENITLGVQEAKKRANEEIQQTKVETAQEVAAAREKAAQEIKSIQEKIEESCT